MRSASSSKGALWEDIQNCNWDAVLQRLSTAEGRLEASRRIVSDGDVDGDDSSGPIALHVACGGGGGGGGGGERGGSTHTSNEIPSKHDDQNDNNDDDDDDDDDAKRVQVVQELLRAFPLGAECVDSRGCVPLHVACGTGAHLAIMEALVAASPKSVCIQDDSGRTPLHLACCAGDNEVMEGNGNNTTTHNNSVTRSLTTRRTRSLADLLASATLSSSLSSSSSSAADSRTALSYQEKVVRILLASNKRAARLKDQEGSLPLHVACSHGAPVTVVRELIRVFPAASRTQDDFGCLPLHNVARRGPAASSRVARELIRSYPSAARMANRRGSIPLHEACYNGSSVEVVRAMAGDGGEGGGGGGGNTAALPTTLSSSSSSSSSSPRGRGLLSQPLLMLPNYGGPDVTQLSDRTGALPVHLAVKGRRSSARVVMELLRLYPQAATLKVGMERETILHMTCRAAAAAAAAGASSSNLMLDLRPPPTASTTPPSSSSSWEIFLEVLSSYPHLASIPDCNGNLPLHDACASATRRRKLLVCEEEFMGNGAVSSTSSSVSTASLVVRELLRVYPEGARVRNTPLGSPAGTGDLPHHRAVIGGSRCDFDVFGELCRSYPPGTFAKGWRGKSPLSIALQGTGGSSRFLLSNNRTDAAICQSSAAKLLRAAYEPQTSTATSTTIPQSRGLAMHDACAYGATDDVVTLIHSVYPDAVREQDPDDDDRLPLHVIAAGRRRRRPSRTTTLAPSSLSSKTTRHGGCKKNTTAATTTATTTNTMAAARGVGGEQEERTDSDNSKPRREKRDSLHSYDVNNGILYPGAIQPCSLPLLRKVVSFYGDALHRPDRHGMVPFVVAACDNPDASLDLLYGLLQMSPDALLRSA